MKEQDIIELLSALIGHGSVNPGDGPVRHRWQGERRVATFVAEWLRAAGLSVQLDEYVKDRCNVIARLTQSPDRPTVLLDAHMDTVDIDWPEADRFRARVRDGAVFGLGAADDKGSLCALMLAVRELARSRVDGCNVILLASGDEEHGFSGVRRALAQGLSADGAIVCEPTRMRIVRRHKAIRRWVLRCRGRSAHSSTPELGRNAIYRAARAVTALETLGKELAARGGSELLTAPTLSVGVIRGGRQVNSVPDMCEVLIDRRALPEEDTARVEAEVREAITAALPETDAWSLETTLHDLPLDTAADAWIVRKLSQAVTAAGAPVKLVGENYGTDAGKVAAAGIPAVVFGPGDAACVHAPGEHIRIDEVARTVEVLMRLLTTEAIE